jgi:hypothetical protein
MFELKVSHLLREPSFPKLAISSSSSNGSEFPIRNFDNFSNILTGDKITHGSSGINSNNKTLFKYEC